MKITKESLRRMIIQEIGDYIDTGMGVGGKEMMRSDFQSTNFEDNVARIRGLLDDMETNVRDDETISAGELNNLKNVYLTILFRKIEEVKEAITKKSAPVTRHSMRGEPNEYKGKFARNMMMIVPLLVKMKKDVASNTQYEKQDLEYFKNKHLDNLTRKIGFLEGAIDARLSGKFDEVE